MARRHSPEFRIEIAQQMLAGASVTELSRRYRLPRSMMYRWRDAYRRVGGEGLSRPMGRPGGGNSRSASISKPGKQEGVETGDRETGDRRNR